MKKIKVLICDDSRIMRKLISNVIEADERIEVVGQAEHGVDCLEKIVQFQPDVVTLDLNMPVMDGLTVLRESKARGLGATFLVVSSLAKKDAQITIDALTEGAIDFILKPSQAFNIASMGKEVIEKILIASMNARKVSEGGGTPGGSAPAEAAPPTPPPAVSAQPGAEAPPAAPGSAPTGAPAAASANLEAAALRMMQQRQQTAAANTASASLQQEQKWSKAEVTIIGGSSGSIQTLVKVIPFLPGSFSRTVIIVLHLPPFFTTQFTQQLSHKCPVPVCEAADGMKVESKRVYLAPGGERNMILQRLDTGDVVFRLIDNDANMLYTPSIDIVMSSTAEAYKKDCRGILISGTGTDGVEGLRSIRNGGGGTFVQDKATAIANQLPFAALKAGVVDKALSIQDMLDLLAV